MGNSVQGVKRVRKHHLMKPNIQKATVLGGGAFGTCLAHVLGRQGVNVKLWALEQEVCDDVNRNHVNSRFLKGIKLPSTISATNDLALSLKGTELVLIVIPTPHIRGLMSENHKYLPVGVPLICCSKGIENSSLLTPSAILKQELPGKFHPFLGVLSGPSFAFEVATEAPTSVVVAADRIEVAKNVQTWMTEPNFTVTVGPDMIGAEICGAVKNVIAIACGACDGLNLGRNAMAMLITKGLQEATKLAIQSGGQPNTMLGLAGIGDLVLTCTSVKSRNYTFGNRVGKGENPKDLISDLKTCAEGVHTCKSIRQITEKVGIKLPLCDAVYEVVWEGKSLKSVGEDFAALIVDPGFNAFELHKKVQSKL